MPPPPHDVPRFDAWAGRASSRGRGCWPPAGTLVAALQFGSLVLVTLFTCLQVLAFVWYVLSYIPFARTSQGCWGPGEGVGGNTSVCAIQPKDQCKHSVQRWAFCSAAAVYLVLCN